MCGGLRHIAVAWTIYNDSRQISYNLEMSICPTIFCCKLDFFCSIHTCNNWDPANLLRYWPVDRIKLDKCSVFFRHADPHVCGLPHGRPDRAESSPFLSGPLPHHPARPLPGVLLRHDPAVPVHPAPAACLPGLLLLRSGQVRSGLWTGMTILIYYYIRKMAVYIRFH